MLETVISFLKRLLPAPLVNVIRSIWHPSLSFLNAFIAGFPAYHMTTIGVTGTKGKSTVCDMLHAIFSAAGYKTALVSTIRFAIGEHSEPNLFKMTMPGRGYIQRFLGKAKRTGCTYAIIEITSEGARTYRHAFLALNALMVTNIHKEHIESHGSFENYVAAKRAIVSVLETSPKKNRVLVINEDNEYTKKFLDGEVPQKIGFGKRELTNLTGGERSVSFSYKGADFTLQLPGVFNALNALAAIKVAEHFGIPLSVCKKALAELPVVRGRVERIDVGQNFTAVVDYAHTPDSLKALYSAFKPVRETSGSISQRKLICVLGNTGGGRDRWKRPLMGKIADENCDVVILTDEDPYDEDPRAIVEEMAAGMSRKPLPRSNTRSFEKSKRGRHSIDFRQGNRPLPHGPPRKKRAVE